MTHYVNFIGYSAFFLTRKNRVEASHDFVTGRTTIFFDGGYVELSDISAIGSWRKGLDLTVSFKDTEDSNNNVVTVTHPMDHNEAIRRFTERHFILETILQQGCGIGRKFRRAPYPKYAEKVWRAGVIKVDLHGHGEMEERKLRIDKMPLDQMYVVTKDENGYAVFGNLEDAEAAACPRDEEPNAEAYGVLVGAEFAVQTAIAGVHPLG